MRKRTIYSRDYEGLLRLLRQARREAGVSQIELGKRLRATQSSISKYERGELRLDVVQLRDWCRALKTPFLDLVTRFDRQAG